MLDEEKLYELERLALEATPGPWETNDYGVVGATHRPVAAYPPCGNARDNLTQAWRDGDFIAAASPDVVLALVQELKEARGIE